MDTNTPIEKPDAAGLVGSGAWFGSVKRSAFREVIKRMQRGETLMWWGRCGPEISGRAKWPQARTVKAMLRAGLLKWGEYNNETQKRCGIRPLVLANAKAEPRPLEKL